MHAYKLFCFNLKILVHNCIYIFFSKFYFIFYFLITFNLGAKEKLTKKTDNNVTGTMTDNRTDDVTTATGTLVTGITKTARVSESEFISDTFKTSEKDLEEVQEGMKKLGIDTLAKQVTDGASGNGKIILLFYWFNY